MTQTQHQYDTPVEEAYSRIVNLPIEMIEQAKTALQKLSQEDFQTVQPLARLVGWTEGLTFAVHSYGGAQKSGRGTLNI